MQIRCIHAKSCCKLVFAAGLISILQVSARTEFEQISNIENINYDTEVVRDRHSTCRITTLVLNSVPGSNNSYGKSTTSPTKSDQQYSTLRRHQHSTYSSESIGRVLSYSSCYFVMESEPLLNTEWALYLWTRILLCTLYSL
jgi:hypothetical protein